MKGTAVMFTAALATALTGCASGHAPRPAVTVTVTVTPGAPSTAKTTPSSPTSATANERTLLDALAATITVIPARVVAGPLMRAYAQFEHAYSSAKGAAGQPDQPGNVTETTGGFKVCYPATSNAAANCEAFTQFTTNQAGQVTGMAVKGQPVADRIATAPVATSDGLMITNVVAYRITRQDFVVVAFKLTDSSYRPVNTSPSLLASLNGASDDATNDALPAFLAPGDSLYAAAAFDITQTTGLFCLQPNGSDAQLPCTTLTKV